MREFDADRVYAALGQRIRVIRQSLGLTQVDLAHALELSRTSITNIEVGRQRVLLHQLLQLADVLHTSAKDLVEVSEKAEVASESGEPLPDRTIAWIERARAQGT